MKVRLQFSHCISTWPYWVTVLRDGRAFSGCNPSTGETITHPAAKVGGSPQAWRSRTS
ncbi:hypothetical protein PCAR4_900076 [Paraburkholderia caribensis]|nr:hypothetical protein PCAR4_900076 [Paraburkholderia caribensis]